MPRFRKDVALIFLLTRSVSKQLKIKCHLHVMLAINLYPFAVRIF